MRTLLERTKDELSREIHWSKKAVVINIYNMSCLSLDNTHSFADTARHLNVSRAYVSECIKLANLFSKNPEIIHMSRKAALKMVRE